MAADVTPAPESGLSEADWLAAIASANLSGDHLRAIDLATRALAEHPRALSLAYQRALGFVRVGSAKRAQQDLAALQGDLAPIADRKLSIDFGALKGRLLKDRAMRAAAPAERAALSAEAAAAYESVFRQWPSCFPAVNAATLWRVAGQSERAAEMARGAIEEAGAETDAYWRLASEGEAWLHLGDEARAVERFVNAAKAGRGRLDALAATRRQRLGFSTLLASAPRRWPHCRRPPCCAGSSSRDAASRRTICNRWLRFRASSGSSPLARC